MCKQMCYPEETLFKVLFKYCLCKTVFVCVLCAFGKSKFHAECCRVGKGISSSQMVNSLRWRQLSGTALAETVTAGREGVRALNCGKVATRRQGQNTAKEWANGSVADNKPGLPNKTTPITLATFFAANTIAVDSGRLTDQQ